MTHDPLITAALLGTARSPVLPPAPDPTLESEWQAIPRENPAAALLQALALTRALRHAGAKTRPALESVPPPCAAETRATLAPAAVELARRLLSGDHAEFLPEWLQHVRDSGKILPARSIPDFLAAATKDPALRPAATTLTGERGLWLAHRHPEFAWLLESTTPAPNAWDEGTPAERLAWLRHTRTTDPIAAAAAISSHWKNEDAAMRDSIARLTATHPDPADEPWLETHALADRRQEIREAAAVALISLPGSAFHRRAHDRARPLLRIERHLLRRTLVVEPPATFDPAWVADAIRQKPPQNTGEKAWWLRQIIAQIPLDAWPAMLDIEAAKLCTLPVDPDWRDALLLGWIDSATRIPQRALPEFFLPFLAALDPWPLPSATKNHLLANLIAPLPAARAFPVIERTAQSLTTFHAIDLLSRIATPPPPGHGAKITAIIDKAIHAELAALTRPQARSLAACIPPADIQGRLERIAKLHNLPTATEEFATALEFRRSMLLNLTNP